MTVQELMEQLKGLDPLARVVYFNEFVVGVAKPIRVVELDTDSYDEGPTVELG